MVAPVPAQISKLPPRLPAAALRPPTTHYPPLTAHSHFQLLCFLSNPYNPSSFMQLRTLLRNGAPLSLLFSMASALFLSPRECTLCVAFFPVLGCSTVPTLVFASVCRLFVVSLRSFRHSLPLFSMACSLFSPKCRGVASADPLGGHRGGWGIPIRFLDSRRESARIPGAGDARTGHPGRGVA
jgi:hypothetical protein